MFSQQAIATSLAFINQFQPELLFNFRLAAKDLRQLISWLSIKKRQRSKMMLENFPVLAHQLILLECAHLIFIDSGRLFVTPTAHTWIIQNADEQKHQLLTRLSDLDVIGNTINRWRAHWLKPLPMQKYIGQQIARQFDKPVDQLDCLSFVDRSGKEIFRTPLKANISSTFYLHQFAEKAEPFCLKLSAHSIYKATARGFSMEQIKYWLQEGSLHRPDEHLLERLISTGFSSSKITLSSQILLESNDPDLLHQWIKNEKLDRQGIKRISRRHATVPASKTNLIRRSAKKGSIPLIDQTKTSSHESKKDHNGVFSALALQILVEMSQVFPLPFSVPHELARTSLANQSPLEQAEIHQLVSDTIERLNTIIRGRDAFFPASKSSAPGVLPLIQQALAEDFNLLIAYQSLAQRAPSWRRVEPFFLEQKGHLFYLEAYCYRTERVLTFRLDRIHQAERSTS